MSDDLVKRYQLDYHHTQTYAEMVEDCDGDWVKYNDYKAASDRIEELQAENKRLKSMIADVIHDTGDDPKIMAASRAEWAARALTAEAKLAKAVELAEEAFDFNIEDDGPRAWHSINDRIEELKGQDDE